MLQKSASDSRPESVVEWGCLTELYYLQRVGERGLISISSCRVCMVGRVGCLGPALLALGWRVGHLCISSISALFIHFFTSSSISFSVFLFLPASSECPFSRFLLETTQNDTQGLMCH